MASRRDELESLSLDALRSEARRCGLPVGRTLSRRQLIELLSCDTIEGSDVESVEGTESSATLIPPRLATVTMASIFAEQGLETEAAQLCRAVLARKPHEPRASRLLRRLERSEAAGRLLPAGQGGSHVALWWQGPTVLFAAWQVEREPGDIDGRAARLAGAGATRVLRLFSAWRDATGVRQQVRDEPVDGLRGQMFLEEVPAGATHRAAVGWLGETGNFLPLCSSPAASTPTAAPLPARERPRWAALTPAAERPRSRAAAEKLAARLQQPGVRDFPWEGARGDEPLAGWPAADSSPDLADKEAEQVPEAGNQGAGSSWARSR